MHFDNKTYIKAFSGSLLLVFLYAITAFGVEVGGGETVVAEGDGFRLTQKEFDNYRSAIAPNTRLNDSKGLLASILMYELFSMEYAENQKKIGVDPYPERPVTIEMKILAAKKYTQQVLNDCVLPKDVIESYYRSYPEKFKIGKLPDGKISVVPLDDNLKNEIKFIIVEKDKNRLIEETVQILMSKYNVRIVNENK